MDPRTLLGTTFDCACTKQHTVPTRALYYSDNAFDHLLPTIEEIDGIEHCLIIADCRTYAAAGQLVEEKLRQGRVAVELYLVPDDKGEPPVADDRTKDLILAQTPDTDLFIAVGSGVINDLVKWVAFLREKPYICIATAASMNGYASANVAASVDGLKILFHAKPCLAIFSTPQILRDAPFNLTTSGLGDVLAKTVSSADWKLNHFLFNDYYCRFSVDLLKDLEPVYLNNPIGIRGKDPTAMQALFEALFLSSVAMTITGTSSPASGGEHLISHSLDMLAARDGGKHDLHGRQVGIASILMAALYEKVLAIDCPVFYEIPRQVDEDYWGILTPVVAREYEKKLPRCQMVVEILSRPEAWEKLRELLRADMVPAMKLKNCLSQAGAAHRIGDIEHFGVPLTRTKLLTVIRNANQMRERFTILDLAMLLGVIPNALEDLVDEWLG
ncbi:MAG: iron-containing alcohol dehydrogenase [Desulforhopalus sp.]